MIMLVCLFIVFLFGLIVGSFLNVCIYRLPQSKSIVFPGSMCPQCGAKIPFYDNIPVLSYLLLGGKCRFCKTVISPRYPLVEFITGLMASCLFLKFGATVEFPIYFIFTASLLVVTFIDIDHKIIPDMISLPGIIIFFAASFFHSYISYIESLLGILLGGGCLYAIAWLYAVIKKKEGMGGGDIKLLAMIGAAVGWKGVVFTLFVSSTIGAIIGIVIMAFTEKNMKLTIPFGPFLSIGAMTYIFFGPELIHWYVNVLT